MQVKCIKVFKNYHHQQQNVTKIYLQLQIGDDFMVHESMEMMMYIQTIASWDSKTLQGQWD